MNTISRRLTVVTTVAFLVFAPAILYVAPAFDTRPACQRAQSWVEANLDNLPTTVSELAAFPESMRRYIFSALPPEGRASVWREQLITFRNSRTLTAEQRRLIDESLSYLTATTYSETPSTERSAQQAAFLARVNRAVQIFSADDAKVFFRLGHGVSPNESFASVRVKLADLIRRSGTAVAGQSLIPNCECSVWSETYDCFGGHCDEDYNCARTFGCGGGGLNYCTGLCF